jgi:hypothetical protein
MEPNAAQINMIKLIKSAMYSVTIYSANKGNNITVYRTYGTCAVACVSAIVAEKPAALTLLSIAK